MYRIGIDIGSTTIKAVILDRPMGLFSADMRGIMPRSERS